MKWRILFLTYSGWMGGIYYIKNQIIQLLSYMPARKNLSIYIYISKEALKEYEDLLTYRCVNIIFKEDILKNFFVKISKGMKWDIDADIAYLVWRYKIKYVFPYFPRGKWNKRLLLNRSISWIADFQHLHLPELFEKNDLRNRELDFKEIADEHNKLVLSSQSVYKDYINKYPDCEKNVYIVPFCSALDKTIVERDEVELIKEKYHITGNYFIMCNQFWTHKNHMIVFKALKSALQIDNRIIVVCTGDMTDYRNKGYIYDIKRYLIENGLQNNVFLLGMIDKADQIQLLKGAIALIQPSLFEGWGTCVEDAKTLKKRVLLSNIDIHHEQMNKKCRLFDPYDSCELMELIIKLWNQEKNNLQGNGYSLKNAKNYGETFYRMLFDGEY